MDRIERLRALEIELRNEAEAKQIESQDKNWSEWVRDRAHGRSAGLHDAANRIQKLIAELGQEVVAVAPVAMRVVLPRGSTTGWENYDAERAANLSQGWTVELAYSSPAHTSEARDAALAESWGVCPHKSTYDEHGGCAMCWKECKDGKHQWEEVSTKGGMMLRCKSCHEHRWPIPKGSAAAQYAEVNQGIHRDMRDAQINMDEAHNIAFEIGGLDDDGGYYFTAEELEQFVRKVSAAMRQEES